MARLPLLSTEDTVHVQVGARVADQVIRAQKGQVERLFDAEDACVCIWLAAQLDVQVNQRDTSVRNHAPRSDGPADRDALEWIHMAEFIEREGAWEGGLVLPKELLASLQVGHEHLVLRISHQLQQLHIWEASVLAEAVWKRSMLAGVRSGRHEPPEMVEHAPVERLQQRNIAVHRQQRLVVTKENQTTDWLTFVEH